MDILNKSIDSLAERGILGLLLGLALFVIYILFKLLMSEKDKRLEDAKQLNNGLMAPIKQIQENGENQITLLRQFINKFDKI